MVDGAEDFVDFADGGLVLEEDLRVELGNFGVVGFADHFAFAGVHKGAHFCVQELAFYIFFLGGGE